MASLSGSSAILPPARARVAVFLILFLLIDLIILGAVWTSFPLLMALAGAVALFFAAQRREWTLALLLVGSPLLVPVMRGMDSTVLVQGGLRLLVAALLVWAVWNSRSSGPADCLRHVLRQPLFWCTSGMAAALVVGVQFSESPLYGTYKTQVFFGDVFLSVGALFVLGWIWRNVDADSAGPQRFLGAAWLFLALIAAVGAANIVLQFEYFATRLRVLDLNPIWLARTAGLGLLLAPYAVRRLRWPVTVVGVAALLAVVTMLWSGSRGPLGALGLTAGVLAVERIWRSGAEDRSRAVLLLAGGLLLVLLGVALLPAELRRRFLGFEGPHAIQVGLSWRLRLYLWDAALHQIAQAFPFGLGTGGFAMAVAGADLRLYPHNIILESLVELGLVGFILVAAVVVLAWRAMRRLQDDAPVREEARAAWRLFLFAGGNALISGDFATNAEIWVWAGFLGALQGTRRSLSPA
ncbi:MAG: hypothetical protein GF355_17665 [Candidatus Eisenbacteria bacterium]|nr:hypothetical protein [Candidatus Eisenbacteria bacterium]